MKKVVILQPGYLPWLGFFDQMLRADVFVLLEDVQYTVRDWRSRNRIKTADGVLWLTVPVRAKGVRTKLIKEVEIDNQQNWQRAHLKNFETFYRKAEYFDEIISTVNDIYHKKYRFLIDVDMDFILKVKEYLSIPTKLFFSSTLNSAAMKDEKLLSVCKSLDATHYMSGTAAQNYLREDIFADEGIVVEWQDFCHPFYNQLWIQKHGFVSHLSIIDLLFNHGKTSLDILSGKRLIPQPEGITVTHANEV
jgi:hypothetical protein